MDPLEKLMSVLESANKSYHQDTTHADDCSCRGCAYVRTLELFVDKYREDKATLPGTEWEG